MQISIRVWDSNKREQLFAFEAESVNKEFLLKMIKMLWEYIEMAELKDGTD